MDLAREFVRAGNDLGVETVMASGPVRHSGEMPALSQAALAEADACMMITSGSFTHTKGRADATARGCRIASMPTITEEIVNMTLNADYDEVERIGVERSRAALEEAALVLLLCDGSVPFTEEDARLLEEAMAHAPTILVWTKGDLPSAPVPVLTLDPMPPVVEVSVKTGQGLDELAEAVERFFPAGNQGAAGELLTNLRQADAARRALEDVARAEDSLAAGVTPDALLTDVEEALSALGELTGANLREDVTARIFERFCVGK